MFVLTTMSKVVLALNALEVVDSVDDRECLGFLDASQDAHPLLRVEVPVVKVIKVLCTQP